METSAVYQSPISGEQGKWEKIKLTPAQRQAWMETRTAVLWTQSAFADVWFRMMVDADKELAWFTDRIPITATDDKFMYANPTEFFKYPLMERVFIGCHELCHSIFNHCGIFYRLHVAKQVVYPDGLVLPFDINIIQVSTDCLINDLLLQGKVGVMPADAHHRSRTKHGHNITFEDDILSAYRKMFQNMFGGGKRGAQNYSPSNNPTQGTHGKEPSKGFDEHLKPGQAQGQTTSEAMDQRNQQEWDNAVAAAIKVAKAQGKLSAALERGLGRLLEPRIDWRDRVHYAVTRRIGNDCSTWSDLDGELMMRGIGAPGRIKYSCDLVVCVVDTSGSVDQDTMDMFNSEVAGILAQMLPRRLVLMQCDAEVTDFRDIDDPQDLVTMMMRGGGGTDFRPPFKQLDEEGLTPDLLIYLTDMYGDFPVLPPEYPVIWATITPGKVGPFGETIDIPKQIGE